MHLSSGYVAKLRGGVNFPLQSSSVRYFCQGTPAKEQVPQIVSYLSKCGLKQEDGGCVNSRDRKGSLMKNIPKFVERSRCIFHSVVERVDTDQP
jgi:hypothetical protein